MAGRGVPDTITMPKGTATTGVTDDYKTTFTYNDAGQKTSTQSYAVQGGEPVTDWFLYDERGNLVSAINAEAGITTAPADTDKDGIPDNEEPRYTTRHAYDLLNRKIEEILPDPDGAAYGNDRPTTAFSYDFMGNLTSSQTTTAGTTPRTVNFEYDGMGRLLKTVNPDGTMRTSAYDAAGNLDVATDELGRVFQSVYDARNRPIAAILPDGSTLRTVYDGGGHVVQTVDALGNTADYEYDKLGRKVKELMPYPGTSRTIDDDTDTTSENADDFMILTDPPNGHWTSPTGYTDSAYDGDLHKATAGSATVFDTIQWTVDDLIPGATYEVLFTWRGTVDNDAVGFAIFDGAPTGTMIAVGSVNQKVLPTGHPVFGDRWQALADPVTISNSALRVQMNNKNGETLADAIRVVQVRPEMNYAYDARGNLECVSDTRLDSNGDFDMDRTIQYTYDNLGRKTSVTVPDPDGDATVNPYGAATTEFTYDAHGNLLSTTDARDHTTWYVYDELDRRTLVVDALGSEPDAEDPYPDDQPEHSIATVYDRLGRVITVTDQLGRTSSNRYDNLGRTIETKLPDPGPSASHGRPHHHLLLLRRPGPPVCRGAVRTQAMGRRLRTGGTMWRAISSRQSTRWPSMPAMPTRPPTTPTTNSAGRSESSTPWAPVPTISPTPLRPPTMPWVTS